MIKHRPFFALLLFVFVVSANAQHRDFAQNVIDTLCSDDLAGRGYVNDGDAKAAEYIADQYQKIGLKPLTKHYFQHFKLDVNTIPTCEVKLGERTLEAGIDYMVAPHSGSVEGRYSVFHIDEKLLGKRSVVRKVRKAVSKGQAIAIGLFDERDQKLQEQLASIRDLCKGHLLIIQKKNLIWSVSRMQAGFAELWFTQDVGQIDRISVNIDAEFKPRYRSQNVLGYVEGTAAPDTFIIFCGHYDHLGKMGDAIYYGANDNASGIAMLLDMAQYFVDHPQHFSIAFIAFGGEEAGLVGSRFHVMEDPTYLPLERTRFVFNMDLMGNGEDGATIVNGSLFPEYFEELVKLNSEKKYLPSIRMRGKAANSDHYFFGEKGVPSFFIYTMGSYTHYHIPQDNANNLELGEYYDRSFQLIRDYIIYLNQ